MGDVDMDYAAGVYIEVINIIHPIDAVCFSNNWLYVEYPFNSLWKNDLFQLIPILFMFTFVFWSEAFYLKA